MLERGLSAEEVEEDKELLQQDWEAACVMDFLQVRPRRRGQGGIERWPQSPYTERVGGGFSCIEGILVSLTWCQSWGCGRGGRPLRVTPVPRDVSRCRLALTRSTTGA